MRKSVAAVFIAFFLIATGAFAQTKPSEIPAEWFASLPKNSNVSLSPDGKHFSIVSFIDGVRYVVITPMGGKPLMAIPPYDGFSIDMESGEFPTARQVKPFMGELGLGAILVAFPCNLEDLKPVFEMSNELDCRFVAINAKYFPLTPEQGADFVRQALDLAASSGVEAHFELHRYTLTNDLFYTAQVMDLVPDMEIIADLSHAVVGREAVLPLDDVHDALFNKVVDRAAGLQGRIASREQVQVSVTWPQHQDWVAQFEVWWERAIRGWRARKPADARLNFLCELGPAPYAITGEDGYELVDRWDQALILKQRIRDIWNRVEADCGQS